MTLQATTWQTVGPYFSIGMKRLYNSEIAHEAMRGERIHVRGRVLDGDLMPIPDALLEIWQADADGNYPRPQNVYEGPLQPPFRAYGRIPTDDEGYFAFSTIKPGPALERDGMKQAPHLVVGLMMRGLLKRLITRIYFPGETLNSTDAILLAVEPARRNTLLLDPDPAAPGTFNWQIHMQGERETVFFDF